MASAPPNNPSVQKPVRNLHPIGVHLARAYNTNVKLGFLLNNKKSIMGNSQTGFALRAPAIKRLRSIYKEDPSLGFLPGKITEREEDESLAAKLYFITGQSVLEHFSDAIRQFIKPLMMAISRANDEDESDENNAKIIQLFNEPVDTKNPQSPTPFKLLRQVQQALMNMRQRMQMEIDVFGRVRKGLITDEDCQHALTSPNLLEVKGRIVAAEPIFHILKTLRQIKQSGFKGEFHPKITLERAITNLENWGPGTPPRKIELRDHPSGNKIPVLNQKLKEQLQIFDESAAEILQHTIAPQSSQEMLDYATQMLKKSYDPLPPPEPSEDEESPAPETTPMPRANPLDVEEIIQFYQHREPGNTIFLVQALHFETAVQTYLKKGILGLEQTKELREIFVTTLIDLTCAIDLFLSEGEKICDSIRNFTAKSGINSNAGELGNVVNPGKNTHHLHFTDAIYEWTWGYVKVLKKYVMLNEAIRDKIITEAQTIEDIAFLDTNEAIDRITQLQALTNAFIKGYISEEQQKRFLDSEQTSTEELQSVASFFTALGKYDFEKRCIDFTRGILELISYYEPLIEKDPTFKKNFSPVLKELKELAAESSHTQIIQDMLSGESYKRTPESISLIVQRLGHALELKLKYEGFVKEYGPKIQDLNKALKSGYDFELYNKIFYVSEDPEAPSLLGMLNLVNGSEEACDLNIFHDNDNILFRKCLLNSFKTNIVDESNVTDLIGMDYFVSILTHFQIMFFHALRKILILDVETQRDENGNNSLGIKKERIAEMRQECEAILTKQMPISLALKKLESIWQSLEKNKVIATNAKSIAMMQQKWEGSIPGGSSLHQRLKSNPNNREMLEDYATKMREAIQKYQKDMEQIAQRLRDWKNKQDDLPSHIREYQRQILIMERSIAQTVEEIRELNPKNRDDLLRQVQEKKIRIAKYRKTLEKFKKDNPHVNLSIP
ncbi:MAG: hypothetical protein HQM12_09565 [SAR324 cluster bacterium]|nr:hypothetical protein [SAR324 cluster bacterium]